MQLSDFALRPSAADTWVNCFGSVQMMAQFPPDNGPEALEGEAAHWAATETLAGHIVRVGDTAPNGVVITDEMIDGAAMYVAAVVQRIAPDEWHIEQTLPIPYVHEQNGGTSDTWGLGYEPWLLHVVDYKFGYGFVEVFENWQCLDYVSGAIHHLQSIGRWKPEYEERIIVEITIVQPRSYHRDGPVRSWRVKLSDLRAHFNILHNAAHEALKPNPPTTPGEHCRYCTARHACDALQRAALNVCDVAGTATPFNLTPAQTGAELRRLDYAAKLLAARKSGLEVQALSMIKAGQSVPYYIAEASFGRLAWREGMETAVIAMGQLLGHDLAKPQQPITPTQAKNLGIDEAVISEYSHRPRGEIKLVPQDTTATRKIFGGKTA